MSCNLLKYGSMNNHSFNIKVSLFFINLLLLSLMILSFPLKTLAQDVEVSIIDVEPYGLSVGDRISGIHADYLKKVLEIAKITYSINIKPYPRVIKDLQDNKAQLSLFFKRSDLINTVEIDKSIGFFNFIVSHVDSPITNISKLVGKHIGVIRDAKYEDSFDKDKSIQKMQLDNYLQGLNLLKLKRVDGLVISEAAYFFYLQTHTQEKRIFSKPIILNRKHNYIYSNKSIGIENIKKIQKANQFLIKSDFLESILIKYK
ncbi:hypothetical protein A9Q84_03035 [Halobacteriovorax marinus]|uniref:Uncharacterized protein n=1 Tax=Halobacteriovorax marinus TaxID=97084 RepID=A0A1Y5FD01_9BACT|nr:hypothetical protein A9Q84_03035 [Halobacteriovorax marinus]